MPTLPISDFGRGRVTARNASLLEPGEARDSLNLLHTDGVNCAKLRQPIGRVNATRADNARVLMIADLVKQDQTRIKLQKVGASLYTFTNTFASTPASILASMDATHLPGYCTANGFMFIADWQVKNYISDGTSAGTNELQKTAPTGSVTGANSAGTAVGNAAGTVYFSYTDYDPTTGAESPPSTAGSFVRLADGGTALTNVSLTFTAPYTQKKFYRTKAGELQMYLLATGVTAANFASLLGAGNEDSLDTSLSTLSEVHGEDILTASIEKPEAAKHCCFHRGRLWLANLAGNLSSRVRWSKLLEPTQFENAEDARNDVGLHDGEEITGLVRS